MKRSIKKPTGAKPPKKTPFGRSNPVTKPKSAFGRSIPSTKPGLFGRHFAICQAGPPPKRRGFRQPIAPCPGPTESFYQFCIGLVLNAPFMKGHQRAGQVSADMYMISSSLGTIVRLGNHNERSLSRSYRTDYKVCLVTGKVGCTKGCSSHALRHFQPAW